mmetsp:Transcript_30277/g.66238  ORF Transcript_30277/g.66238 Transcript_30277/m.66238 type:complete len:958 (+) Transcript_30277:1-2874(+)
MEAEGRADLLGSELASARSQAASQTSFVAGLSAKLDAAAARLEKERARSQLQNEELHGARQRSELLEQQLVQSEAELSRAREHADAASLEAEVERQALKASADTFVDLQGKERRCEPGNHGLNSCYEESGGRYSKLPLYSELSTRDRESQHGTDLHRPVQSAGPTVMQDPSAVPVLRGQKQPPQSRKSPGPCGYPGLSRGSQSPAASLPVIAERVHADSDVVFLDDDVLGGSPTSGNQGQLPNPLAKSGDSKGAGVRYLLGRKQPRRQQDDPERGWQDPTESEVVSQCRDDVATESLPDANKDLVSDLPPHSEPSRSPEGFTGRLSVSTGVLVDRLYEECLARCGGRLRGAAEVKRVLLDLAGEEEGEPDVGPAEPPHLAALLHGLDASSQGDVSRQRFHELVEDALSLRHSQEVRRYEEGYSIECPVPPDTGGGPELGTGLLGQSTRCQHVWTSLPSWSLELSRLSCTGQAPEEMVEGTAAEHWHAVEVVLDRLCEGAGLGQVKSDAVAALEELRSELAHFVRCFASEARARLRSAHTSTGRLLDQRRRVVDDLTEQLEARDLAMQRSLQQCADLTSRAVAAEDRAERAEKIVKAVEEEFTSNLVGKDGSSGATPANLDLAGDGAAAPAGHLHTQVRILRSELESMQSQRDAARQACQAAEQRLQHASTYGSALEREQMSLRSLGMGEASVPGCPGSTPAQSLLEELESAAGESALQRALEAEASLRLELERMRGELERRSEAQSPEDAVVATDAAALQNRLGEMHAGARFEKVAFRHQLKQSRYVRLTFDLQRIEWGPSERGPFKVLPVGAILRVDYGDTSRTYRCYEFGKQGRPPPGRCLSISTPSRSLDLIATSERDVEVWVLGLNEVVPYRPERQRLTAQDFLLRRAILRLEGGDCGDAALDDCEGSSTSSRPSRMSAMDGARQLAAMAGSGSLGSHNRIRRMLPSRLGLGS